MTRLSGIRIVQDGLIALLLLSLACPVPALNETLLYEQLAARFGAARSSLLKHWLQAIEVGKVLAEEGRLKHINDFINRAITFDDDRSVWQQSDYWATPLETIGQGRGDCEDFAIIKYFSLRLAGIPSNKLRLIYVKARVDGPSGPTQVAHMVLAYYASPGAEPRILDNLNPAILPASKRPDLHPVFSFNSEGVFAGVSGKDQASAGSIGKLSRWADLLQRAHGEGLP